MKKLLRRLGGFLLIVLASCVDDLSNVLERRADGLAELSERVYPTAEILADVQAKQ